MQVDAAVEVAFGLGQELGCDAPDVVEGLAADEPGNRREAAPVDRAIERGTGLDVHHVHLGLLGATDRELVGEAVALLRGLPAVEGREAGRIECHRVDEDTLDAIGFDDVEDGELLAGLAAGDEPAVAPPVGGRDGTGPEESLDLLGERVAGGPRLALRLGQVALGRGPLGGAGIVSGLEPAVRVGHRRAVHEVDMIGPVRRRVARAAEGDCCV